MNLIHILSVPLNYFTINIFLFQYINSFTSSYFFQHDDRVDSSNFFFQHDDHVDSSNFFFQHDDHVDNMNFDLFVNLTSIKFIDSKFYLSFKCFIKLKFGDQF